MALRYLNDARKRAGTVFFKYVEQYGNRKLKDIATKLGVDVINMHWHVGRETFGTEFIRKGGDVAVLQKLMDHAKIETTMKYVKIHEDLQRLAIEKMNQVDAVGGGNKKPLRLGRGFFYVFSSRYFIKSCRVIPIVLKLFLSCF